MREINEEQGIALRTLLVAAVGASIAVWDIAFWLGVHGTIFYSKIFTLWIASSVVLIVALIVPKQDRFLNGWGIASLTTPSVWFIINALTPTGELTWLDQFIWIFALLSFALAIPFILYILFHLVETDYWDLSPRYRNRLILVILIVAGTGFLVGLNHNFFVSCQQFTIAGDTAPVDCESWPADLLDGG